MKIVVICPTYNEKENMEKMIPILLEDVFPKIKNHEMYLLIADDNSPDGTGDIVKKDAEKFQHLKLLEGERKGLGRAYVRAMQYAMEHMHADAVIEFDADFQHDPKDIPRLVAAMDEGYDYVIGSRYITGGGIPYEWGFDRKVKSRLGGLFARFMFLMLNIHDMTSGYKLTKTSFLKKVKLDHLLYYNYAYKIQILHDVVRAGAKVKEVPIKFYERTKGKSKMDTNDMKDSFLLVIKLAWKDYSRIVKFLIIGGTGFILQLLLTALCIKAGMSQPVATMIGAEIAILSNFFLNNIWTFGDTKHLAQQSSFVGRLVKFNISSLASIGIQGFVAWIAVLAFGEFVMIAGHQIHTSIAILFPTIIVIVLPLNYIIYNKIIWKTQYLKQHEGSHKE